MIIPLAMSESVVMVSSRLGFLSSARTVAGQGSVDSGSVEVELFGVGSHGGESVGAVSSGPGVGGSSGSFGPCSVDVESLLGSVRSGSEVWAGLARLAGSAPASLAGAGEVRAVELSSTTVSGLDSSSDSNEMNT